MASREPAKPDPVMAMSYFMAIAVYIPQKVALGVEVKAKSICSELQ
jgi:hypothetical protein